MLRACFWQEAAGNALTKGKALGALAAQALATSLASIKVVLSLLAGHELTVFGHLNALCK